jgi:hypothetical protein
MAASPGSRTKTYLIVAGITAALILGGTGTYLGYVGATNHSTATTTMPTYNNTTVSKTFDVFHNRTLYANSTIVQNHTYVTDKTLYANTTYWDNETINYWANTSLFYNTTILEPVLWPVVINGLGIYLVCTGGCPNVTVALNTTNGAGLDELFGVQANVMNDGKQTMTFEGAGLVSYDPTNVTNTSVSPFFLWSTLPAAVLSHGIHPAITITPDWPHVGPNSSKLFRLMVEAPESPGTYNLGIVILLKAGSS